MSGKERSGLLKKGDRKYLGRAKDSHDKTGSDWYAGKRRLRTSIINGVTDFTDIQQELDDWNWPKLVNDIRENENEVREGMKSAIALFYEVHEAMGWDFEQTLWAAVQKAYTNGVTQRDMQYRGVEQVEFNTELIEPDNIDTIRTRIEEKLEADKPLTDSEIAWAARSSPKLFERWQEREPRDSQLKRRERMKKKWLADSDEE